MRITNHDRRRLLIGAGLAVSGLALIAAAGCAREGEETEVGAVEDLMREHGIIRRAILVYRSCAAKLRSGVSVDPLALKRTATLLRSFGENYHERRLEETYIFPAVRKAAGSAAAYVDILLAQHQRGREITDYVLGVTSKEAIGGDTEALARALDAFELMYEHHAAREDTILFPAWKTAIPRNELAEMGEKFEEIEHQQFGEDGFDDAVKQIDDIEQSLGLSDLAQLTPK